MVIYIQFHCWRLVEDLSLIHILPLGREKQVLYSEIAGAIVDLVLNTIFIPIYGAAGAALGTLVAEAVVLGWQCVALSLIHI